MRMSVAIVHRTVLILVQKLIRTESVTLSFSFLRHFPQRWRRFVNSKPFERSIRDRRDYELPTDRFGLSYASWRSNCLWAALSSDVGLFLSMGSLAFEGGMAVPTFGLSGSLESVIFYFISTWHLTFLLCSALSPPISTLFPDTVNPFCLETT